MGSFAMPVLLILALLVQLQNSVAQEGCPNTDSSCQCSTNLPSDSCFLSLGNGTCLDGQCNNGYKCDCNGFEFCSRYSCNGYTAAPGASPSRNDPFRCNLAPGSGTCIVMVDVMNSVRSAVLAVREAEKNNDLALESALLISTYLRDIQNMQKAMNPGLKEVESLAKHLSMEELDIIYSHVHMVGHFAEEMVLIMMKAVQIVHNNTELLPRLHEAFRNGSSAYQKANEKEQALEFEKESPLVNSLVLSDLEMQIENFLADKRFFSMRCNRIALNIRGNYNRMQDELSMATQIKEMAKQSNMLAVGKSQAAITKGNDMKEMTS